MVPSPGLLTTGVGHRFYALPLTHRSHPARRCSARGSPGFWNCCSLGLGGPGLVASAALFLSAQESIQQGEVKLVWSALHIPLAIFFLLGVGVGDFETAYPRYQSFSSDMWIDHAHNDYLEAAAETGLVGALLIPSALTLFVRLAFRHWKCPLRSHAGWIRLGATLGCCGTLVHTSGGFNLHVPTNAAWFAVLAGIASA